MSPVKPSATRCGIVEHKMCIVTMTGPAHENGSGFVKAEACAAVVKRLQDKFGGSEI